MPEWDPVIRHCLLVIINGPVKRLHCCSVNSKTIYLYLSMLATGYLNKLTVLILIS